jgi:hypothetical protein
MNFENLKATLNKYFKNKKVLKYIICGIIMTIVIIALSVTFVCMSFENVDSGENNTYIDYIAENDNIITSKVEETTIALVTSKTTESTTTTTTTEISSTTEKETTTTVEETKPATTTSTSTKTTEETTVTTSQVVTTTTVVTKSNEDIAKEVINGLWGTGDERKSKLTAAGYDYSTIQSIVDESMNKYTTTIESNNSNNTSSASSSTSSYGMSYVKNFSRGTYYAYGGSRYGGSGRSLIDCSYGNGTVKGSIASSYLYNNYGYNYNGKRTMVYLEISGYPSMSGYYYLDDSDAGNSNVIDFFYYYGSNCQFRNQGVVSVDCYIVNY